MTFALATQSEQSSHFFDNVTDSKNIHSERREREENKNMMMGKLKRDIRILLIWLKQEEHKEQPR